MSHPIFPGQADLGQLRAPAFSQWPFGTAPESPPIRPRVRPPWLVRSRAQRRARVVRSIILFKCRRKLACCFVFFCSPSRVYLYNSHSCETGLCYPNVCCHAIQDLCHIIWTGRVFPAMRLRTPVIGCQWTNFGMRSDRSKKQRNKEKNAVRQRVCFLYRGSFWLDGIILWRKGRPSAPPSQLSKCPEIGQFLEFFWIAFCRLAFGTQISEICNLGLAPPPTSSQNIRYTCVRILEWK